MKATAENRGSRRSMVLGCAGLLALSEEYRALSSALKFISIVSTVPDIVTAESTSIVDIIVVPCFTVSPHTQLSKLQHFFL